MKRRGSTPITSMKAKRCDSHGYRLEALCQLIKRANKESKNFGMPREKEYGYSQAVKVGSTIYVSGQVSHDDKGNIVGHGNMEVQMRQAYDNIKKVLAQYGATMDNIVD